VLISSQNWSAAGTCSTATPGVILHHPNAAGYFQRIFLHDWDHPSSQQATDD
jgi:hypothetical protein